jgi:hypothetical protein
MTRSHSLIVAFCDGGTYSSPFFCVYARARYAQKVKVFFSLGDTKYERFFFPSEKQNYARESRFFRFFLYLCVGVRKRVEK